jgi:hypothetical protein
VGERILRVSSTFRRSVERLGVRSGLAAYRGLFGLLRGLATGDLPGASDYETAFVPGRAYVRRVFGNNLWVLYRFDDDHVFVMTARDQPPVPSTPPE